MKKLLTSLILVLLISSLAHSQVARPGGRPIRKPRIDPKLIRLPQEEIPYDRLCIAVGAQGEVITSTDDGATWQVGNIGANITVWGVAQVNKKKFVAVGTHGIYRSADSGTSWAQSTFQKLTPDVLQTFNGVATDGSTKVVAVGKFRKSIDRGMIQRSTDGGATFQLVAPEVPGPLAAVAYTGNNRFVAAGGGSLVYSTDGGATWNDAAYTNTNIIYRRPTDTSSPAPIWNIADIAASTSGRVIAAGGGSFSFIHMPGVIYYSSDGGLSWNDTGYSDKPNWLEGVGTNNQGLWVAVGTNLGMYITSTDNGVSWSEYTDISGPLRLKSVVHVTGNKWLAVGAQGFVIASADNGATWTTVNTGGTKGLFDLVCAKMK